MKNLKKLENQRKEEVKNSQKKIMIKRKNNSRWGLN
jgi:hypothetical protein